MSTFKIGNRVRALNNSEPTVRSDSFYYHKGDIGTVIGIDDRTLDAFVHWDANRLDDGKWYAHFDNLELESDSE